eukprot:m.231258 g.231258  ORF g.231258 m.231258 type:complete len:368 (-) comp22421_c19_seq3:36-1139(-)
MKMRRTQGAKRSTDRREYCSSELSWKRLADTSSFSLPSGSASFLDSVGETGLGGTATMRVKGSSTSSLLMTLSACRMSAARRSATVRLRSAAAGAASPATSPAAPSSAGAGSTASAWSGRSISISAPAWFLSLACFEAGSASAPACSATSKSTTSSPSPASTCRSALSASAATSAAAAPAPCSSSCPSSATAATATTSAWLLCNVCSAGCSTWALHIVPARRPVCCCWCWCGPSTLRIPWICFCLATFAIVVFTLFFVVVVVIFFVHQGPVGVGRKIFLLCIQAAHSTHIVIRVIQFILIENTVANLIQIRLGSKRVHRCLPSSSLLAVAKQGHFRSHTIGQRGHFIGPGVLSSRSRPPRIIVIIRL